MIAIAVGFGAVAGVACFVLILGIALYAGGHWNPKSSLRSAPHPTSPRRVAASPSAALPRDEGT